MKQNSECLLLMTGAFHTDGGIAAVNRLVIKCIADESYSLDIFSLLENDATPDARYIPTGGIVNCQAFSGKKVPFTLAVWQAVLRKRYRYVFVDHVNLASVLAPLAWMKRCRYTVWLFGIDVFAPRPDWEGRLGMLGAWKRLAISEYTRGSVVSRFPKLAVDVCDLALDPILHVSAPASEPAHNSPPVVLQAADGSQSRLESNVILHVGRMVSGERYKGQDSLIRAFSIVVERHPQAQLVLAGRGDDMSRLTELARSLPLTAQARIFFPGYVPDDLLDQIYQDCYVFAMPSVGEGFGLVYLEAMSRGKACLGGKVDATPYVVRDGITGMLVDDPHSPTQVAAALIWFLAHPEETLQMGRQGAELVHSYYLYPHFQQRFWKVLGG